MKRFLGLTVFAAMAFTGNATFAADECTKITATGHPQYPAIAYKDGDNIVGAAPALVGAIAKTSRSRSSRNTWGRGRRRKRCARWQGRHDFRHLLQR